MAGPAKRLVFTDAPHIAYPSIDALMTAMAESGRTAARGYAESMVDPGAWAAFERWVDQTLAERLRTLSKEALDAESHALVGRVRDMLDRQSSGPARVRIYQTCIETIDDARMSGQELTTFDAMARHVHATVVWYSVSHLVSAGLGTDLSSVIAGARTLQVAAAPQRPVPISPQQASPAVASIIENRPASAPWSATAARLGKTAQGALSALGTATLASARKFGARALKAGEASQAVAREMANARAQRLKDEAAERKAKIDSAKAVHSAAPTRSEQPQSSSVTPSHRLDGNRMAGSVLGTWLMLVILSWVSLVWGALLSIPLTGPFGVVMAATTGVFAVPIWGTLWGFLGMGAAKTTTLTSMRFKKAEDGDWLTVTTARLAHALDLPVPTVGTIPAFNAFAMGESRRDATVAIGTPLIEHLSPDEVAAVIGHELGHVVSGDMRRMMLMRTFQNATVWFALAQGLKQFARWIICWAAELAILAFSRRREYWADAVGAALTSKEAMIGALRKLEQAPAMTSGERTHARFMFRGNPFSTHPSVAERIAALEAESYIKRLPVKG